MFTIKTTVTRLVSMTVLLMMTAGLANAQDLQYSDLIKRIDTLEKDRVVQQRRIGTLEAQKISMKSQFASFGKIGETEAPAAAGNACDSYCQSGCDGGGCDGGGCGGGGCGGGGCDGGGCGGGGCQNDCCCNSPTNYFGLEFTVLQPNISNITLGPGFGNRSGVGTRLIFGRERSNGVGVRARYWAFNHGHDFDPPAPVTLSMDLDVFDFEATLRERFCNWNLLLSGGLRFGRNAYDLGPATAYFEGAGPTFSLEATRSIGCRGAYLVGNVRGSTLFGDLRNPDGIIGGPPVIADEITNVVDSQIGLGWHRAVRRGDLHLRLVFESQAWMNDTFADPLVGIGSNLGLYGVATTAELRF